MFNDVECGLECRYPQVDRQSKASWCLHLERRKHTGSRERPGSAFAKDVTCALDERG